MVSCGTSVVFSPRPSLPRFRNPVGRKKGVLFSLRTVRQNVRNSESFSRGGELKALPGVGSPPSSYLPEKETRHDKKKWSVVFPLSRR